MFHARYWHRIYIVYCSKTLYDLFFLSRWCDEVLQDLHTNKSCWQYLGMELGIGSFMLWCGECLHNLFRDLGPGSPTGTDNTRRWGLDKAAGSCLDPSLQSDHMRDRWAKWHVAVVISCGRAGDWLIWWFQLWREGMICWSDPWLLLFAVVIHHQTIFGAFLPPLLDCCYFWDSVWSHIGGGWYMVVYGPIGQWVRSGEDRGVWQVLADQHNA